MLTGNREYYAQTQDMKAYTDDEEIIFDAPGLTPLKNNVDNDVREIASFVLSPELLFNVMGASDKLGAITTTGASETTARWLFESASGRRAITAAPDAYHMLTKYELTGHAVVPHNLSPYS